MRVCLIVCTEVLLYCRPVCIMYLFLSGAFVVICYAIYV